MATSSTVQAGRRNGWLVRVVGASVLAAHRGISLIVSVVDMVLQGNCDWVSDKARV